MEDEDDVDAGDYCTLLLRYMAVIVERYGGAQLNHVESWHALSDEDVEELREMESDVLNQIDEQRIADEQFMRKMRQGELGV